MARGTRTAFGDAQVPAKLELQSHQRNELGVSLNVIYCDLMESFVIMGSIWDLHEIYMGFTWDLYGIYMGSIWGLMGFKLI